MCVCARAHTCVRVRAHEHVYHNEKKVPDKIATTTSHTSDTSRNQQQAQCKGKFNIRKRLVFFQSITAILTEKKKKEKQFTKPTHVSVYLFQDLDWSRL